MSVRQFSAAAAAGPLGTVRIERDGNIATLIMSDPKAMNALTVPMGVAFKQAVADLCKLVDAGEVKCVLLTGDTAGKAFSAGGDISWLRERTKTQPDANQKIMMDFYESFLCIRHIKCPTVALISGPAVGAGAALSCGCDFRIATSSSIVSYPFTKLGIHPGMGSSCILPRVLNQQWANFLLMGGTQIKGDDLTRSGFVLETYETHDELKAAGMEMAKNFASNAPVALREVLETLRMQKFENLELALRREAYSQAVCYATTDFGLGLDAVKTRVPPTFTGK